MDRCPEFSSSDWYTAQELVRLLQSGALPNDRILERSAAAATAAGVEDWSDDLETVSTIAFSPRSAADMPTWIDPPPRTKRLQIQEDTNPKGKQSKQTRGRGYDVKPTARSMCIVTEDEMNCERDDSYPEMQAFFDGLGLQHLVGRMQRQKMSFGLFQEGFEHQILLELGLTVQERTVLWEAMQTLQVKTPDRL